MEYVGIVAVVVIRSVVLSCLQKIEITIVVAIVCWQPLWYYTPKRAFPQQRMLPGRFLGVATNQGDAFCYLVLTVPPDGTDERPQVLARSVVRPRYPREDVPVVDTTNPTLQFFARDGKTPLPPVTDEVQHELFDTLAPSPSSPATLSDRVIEPIDVADDAVHGPSKRPRSELSPAPTPPAPSPVSAPESTVPEESPTSPKAVSFEHLDPSPVSPSDDDVSVPVPHDITDGIVSHFDTMADPDQLARQVRNKRQSRSIRLPSKLKFRAL